MKKFFLLVSTISALISADMVVEDIRILGLQRVSLGSVLDTIPVTIGDRIGSRDYQRVIRTLFATGQFDDVELSSDGNVLYISVEERPTISSIKIDGNSAIKTEELLGALGSEGVAEGSVLKRATLDLITKGLQAQYSQQGRYGASVEVSQRDRPRNRVEVSIEVDEGSSTAIASIEIIGNEVYSDDELKRIFELSEGSILSVFTNDDKYTREKLVTDLENLEAYYKDRGYLQYGLESSQVSISDDLEELFITLIINEGDLYTVSNAKVSGEIPLEKEFFEEFINIPEGSYYSEALITNYEEFFANILGNEGYTFAEVEGVPTIDEENKSAEITFVFNPGRKNYTRRILFNGNAFTTDEVLRREMRQFEGAPASNQKIEQSKILLERTGYFKTVNVETVPVPGEEDYVDVIFDVEEQQYGNVVGGFGYSQFGFSFNFNIQQQNFLGSGNTVGIGSNVSDYSKNIFLQYDNPYYTIDGASRGFSLNLREFDYSAFGLTDYNTSSYGAAMTFGFPISEIQRLGVNLSFDHTELQQQGLSSREILDFTQAEGSEFDTFKVQGYYTRITLNRGLFPTEGTLNQVSLQTTVPGSSLNYFRLDYKNEYYQPLFGDFVFKAASRVGYTGAFGDTEIPPYFENFYAGGPYSIKGYEANSLGPRITPVPCYGYDSANDYCPPLQDTNFDGVADTPAYNQYATYGFNRPIGGNVLLETSLNLIFKLPFVEDNNQFRSAFFIDIGNVFSSFCQSYQTQCYSPNFEDLRGSYGLGGSAITPFGPVSVYLAIPFNNDPIDRVKRFEFTVGNKF
ncbi:MAG: outer membrane protein assembly factor BamA [SAR86 cluster bacterium]|uniref:Outer membrane protein assembly factor BamA n=1 Tax=SAR86 cluster bacterium TaxID=2030880 RepID=A0A368BKX7_9GAMM|nr:MAG: outer membrane protein assembly factor BamA [SAR86 cluster bacterium]